MALNIFSHELRSMWSKHIQKASIIDVKFQISGLFLKSSHYILKKVYVFKCMLHVSNTKCVSIRKESRPGQGRAGGLFLLTKV